MPLLILVLLATGTGTDAHAASLAYQKQSTWSKTLLHLRDAAPANQLPSDTLAGIADSLRCEFPVQSDWALQDCGPDFLARFISESQVHLAKQMLSRVFDELEMDTGQRHAQLSSLRAQFRSLSDSNLQPDASAWLDLYIEGCEARRQQRLATLVAESPAIVFTRHPTILPSFFAYTEGQSDAQNERHFPRGAELCLVEMAGSYGKVTTLLRDPAGAIRDPAVSWDARKIVFAWKKSMDQDDYHLYELELASRNTRQLTTGLGFTDYEPSFLPSGDLIFSSTRCVQTVDCWWTEVSNLYTCDPDGRRMRRLTFDQVHSIFPTVTHDGRVLYTRWDYSDRGQIFPQPLFQMNPDGTAQAEFYGNSSWFPTTIAHARSIPGTEKVLSILCGHHSAQAGKLAIIDPARGRQENTGVQLVAPIRQTKAERIDSYGQDGELFQYPYPLNDRECLVTFAPRGWEWRNPRLKGVGAADFAIYWMDMQGRRELLAYDPHMPGQQPVPLVPRTIPHVRASTVNLLATNGTYYMQDIYAGQALAGVKRGTVKKLRVVALEFRAAGVGNNGSSGPGGAALVSTPIAIGNGSWDVKKVLGDATVYADGSAYFSVPARTPLYFQALDEHNHAVQTMRSWSTLQPGETQSCIGCHDNKAATPAAAMPGQSTLALRAGFQQLQPFYGPPRGFSFAREIQPILDRHCIQCHNDANQRMPAQRLAGSITREADPDWHAAVESYAARPRYAPRPEAGRPGSAAFSLMSTPVNDTLAGRAWSRSYLNLTLANPSDDPESRHAFHGIFDGRLVNWIGSQSIPAPLPPYAAGACRSELMAMFNQGTASMSDGVTAASLLHQTTHAGVSLSREELDRIACWIDLLVPYCGDYKEANIWSQEDHQKYDRYLEKRRRMEDTERRNIQELISATK